MGQLQAPEREAWELERVEIPLPAESRPTLVRDLTWVLPTCAARERNSGQLFTKVRAAHPPLTPYPQAKTNRGFREAGPGRGSRERKEEVASTWRSGPQDPTGRKWRASREPRHRSKRRLSRNAWGPGGSSELRVSRGLADAAGGAPAFFRLLAIATATCFFYWDEVPVYLKCVFFCCLLLVLPRFNWLSLDCRLADGPVNLQGKELVFRHLGKILLLAPSWWNEGFWRKPKRFGRFRSL